MSSPRIVRRNTESPKEIMISKKIHISLWRVLCTLWSCLRVAVRTIWYWFQRIFLIVFLLSLTIGLAWWLSQKPSNLRDWNPSESILPAIVWSGNIASIQNVRNYQWTSESISTPGYYDSIYDLDKIESLYYMIVPFSNFDGPAHTMLSFGFADGKKVVISAEIRKERGESFDALKGLMNQFEMIYVIADEQDVIKLRTNYRKNTVYMYPIKTSKEKMQSLFRTMLIRADKLSKEPEFYNTLWNNCTTSILMHANALRDDKIEWSIDTVLPAHSDELVYGLGLIDTSLSLPDARAYYKIDDRARNAGTGAVFSDVIRVSKK